ncbi:UbiA family prenyltransferase [Leifsonia sp. NPDC058194]|uniref:UbiA family prenyltransferase n=1 Tax=Leifsonia sp. NPDC058194 TaxID=3346374 RepID=UPI0036DB7CF5
MSSVVQPRRRALTDCASQVGLAFLEGRPVVIGVFALRFVVGSVLVAGAEWDAPRIWAAGTSWLLAVWAVYLINGISDIEGDRLNGSSRPLASGRLALRPAVSIAVTLLAISLLTATLFQGPFLLAVVAFICLGLVYSVGPWAAKKAGVAALTVAAAGVFLTYLAAARIVADAIPASAFAFALVAASWIALVGHTKDFGDVAGDAAEGRRTLPVILGEQRARVLVSIGTAIVSGGATALALIVEQLRTLLVFGIAGPVVIVMLLVARGSERGSAKRPYRTFMTGQYALNIVALLGALGG